MTLQEAITITQSFRNWTNDATLPMTHTKGEVIEALDIVLGAAKLQKIHVDQYKPIIEQLKTPHNIIENSQVSENHLQREHKIEAK